MVGGPQLHQPLRTKATRNMEENGRQHLAPAAYTNGIHDILHNKCYIRFTHQ